jgi:hypothetical protein
MLNNLFRGKKQLKTRQNQGQLNFNPLYSELYRALISDHI